MRNVEQGVAITKDFTTAIDKAKEIAYPEYTKTTRRAFLKELGQGCGLFAMGTALIGYPLGKIPEMTDNVYRDIVGDESQESLTDDAEEYLKFMVYLGLIISPLLGIQSLIEVVNKFQSFPTTSSINSSFRESLAVFYPEPQSDLASYKTMGEFMRKIYLLPPIGGKTTDFSKEMPITVEPSLTAEAHIQKIIEKRASGELGEEGEQYVHQFTVQTRLPDEFKYVALGILASNPFLHDWDDYFYNAPWGKIAPMIHDGGRTNTVINPNYPKTGRTDFIMRVGQVHKIDLEEIESNSYEEINNMDSSDLENAKKEQHERERMVWQAKAYQRLALSFMAKIGEAPVVLSDKQMCQLIEIWDCYTSELDHLLYINGAESTTRVKWFLDQPRIHSKMSIYGERYEADWKPVKDTLKQLETAKEDNPELCNLTLDLLATSTRKVDEIIGLV